LCYFHIFCIFFFCLQQFGFGRSRERANGASSPSVRLRLVRAACSPACSCLSNSNIAWTRQRVAAKQVDLVFHTGARRRPNRMQAGPSAGGPQGESLVVLYRKLGARKLALGNIADTAVSAPALFEVTVWSVLHVTFDSCSLCDGYLLLLVLFFVVSGFIRVCFLFFMRFFRLC
jgi:hypothetical protein